MNDLSKEYQSAVMKIRQCKKEIGKAVIGQKDVVEQLLLAILCDGNVLLEGVPGLGKTQLAKTVSQVLDLSFSRIQFTPDLMPSDITGTTLITKRDGENRFTFEKGPVFANLVLADEINRATPKTQAALLEAMQEKTVTVGHKTHELPCPFLVLATQNPIENEGTYPLPEAQLDRFLFKLLVPFPDKQELKEIVTLTLSPLDDLTRPTALLSAEDIFELRSLITELPVSDTVMDYAMQLVLNTHPELPDAPEITRTYLTAGASPRGAQAMIRTAKAHAMLDQRFHVSFDDIDYVALPALRHRIETGFEAVTENLSADDILIRLMEDTRNKINL